MSIIYWNQILLPFTQKLTPKMLLKEGTIIKKKCLLVGQSSKKFQSEERPILFDKAFIWAKLQREVLQPLKIDNLEQITSILEKVWDSEIPESEMMNYYKLCSPFTLQKLHKEGEITTEIYTSILLGEENE